MMNIPSTPEHEIVNRRKQKRLIEIFSPLRNHQSIPNNSARKKLPTIREVPTPGTVARSIPMETLVSDDYESSVGYGLVNASKIFNDHVHNNIKLEGLCLRIIDTPEFQRLHGLKQNGTTDFVFRGATHTRFEHSLGVAHLAERFVKTLQRNQPKLGIDHRDILCVKVAGLCHDLGHGPFSHVYDGTFLKRIYPNGIDVAGKKWKHETGSIRMLRHLLIQNDIDITDYGLHYPLGADNLTAAAISTGHASTATTGGTSVIDYNDLTFIEEIINGTAECDRIGRPKAKHYLYDIVNNVRSGLDVDKLDYFQRDMKMSNVFPMPVVTFDRFIELGLVLPAEPISNGRNPQSEELVNMICYPEKMAGEVLNLFAARFHMHQKVYQHKAVKQIEYMITEALELANPYINIRGAVTALHPQGFYKISECIYDMTAMSNLKDTIVDIIMHDPNPLLAPAQHIIRRIWCRDLYSCVGDTSYSLENDMGRYINSQSVDDITAEIVALSQTVCQDRLNNSHSRGSNGTGIAMNTTSDRHSTPPSLLPVTNQASHHHHCSAILSDSDNEEESSSLFVAPSVQIGDDHEQSARKKQRTNGNGNSSNVIVAASLQFGVDNGVDVPHKPKLSTPPRVLSPNNSVTQSQSVTCSQSQSDQGPLTATDFIVEKMHIHYGSGGDNPVSNMRFYTKTVRVDCDPIGRAVDTDAMEAVPKHFQVFKLRLFCRSPSSYKEGLIRQCFELYCSDHQVNCPFPSSSQG